MIFYKSVSAGNDFLHIDTGNLPAGHAKTAMARMLCDRHWGPGADGVVYYHIRRSPTPLPDAPPPAAHDLPGTMESPGVDFDIYNQDGSRAELSGNGMAGLTALMFYLGEFHDSVTLQTATGTKTNQLLEHNDNGDEFRLKIEIGAADFSNTNFFPFLEPGRAAYSHHGMTFHTVSVGNPHIVIIPGEKLTTGEMTSMGKMLEQATIFPHKTNVEFVLGKNPGSLYNGGEECRVYYYERGVGPTLSSSTGSAAVFAVLHALDYIKDHLIISFPPTDTSTGDIRLSATGEGRKRKIYVENCTKIVYKGIYRVGGPNEN